MTTRTMTRTRPASSQQFQAAYLFTSNRMASLDAQPTQLRWVSLRVQQRWAERSVPGGVKGGAM